MAGNGEFVDDVIVRRVLAEHARLTGSVDELTDETDLYQTGMTSLSSVSVMLALENAFDIEFPDRLLRKPTFSTIRSIRQAVAIAVAEQDA
jgi:acyl carrier protein